MLPVQRLTNFIQFNQVKPSLTMVLHFHVLLWILNFKNLAYGRPLKLFMFADSSKKTNKTHSHNHIHNHAQ